MPMIEAERLSKVFRIPLRAPGFAGSLRSLVHTRYESMRAVDSISFAIDSGQIVGYVGRNGAGKSTTIKLLTGILTPTSGLVRVAGLVPWRERAHNALNIGVVFGQRSQLWWDLPLVDSLELVARMYRLPNDAYRRALQRFVELLDLGPFLHRPVRQLSLGQRMRGDLAAAMLYGPRVLFLDEPTIGLDIVAKERIRCFIEESNRTDGTTVLLTTHDLADVERLCPRIILLDAGRILFDGTVRDLKARFAPERTLVLTLAAVPERLVMAGTRELRREGNRVWLGFDPHRTTASALIAATAARWPVQDVALVEPDLEEVVRRLFTESTPVA